MSDLGRCTSGRRVVRKNTPPGLARDNFPEPIQYPPYGPMPGEVAFFQDAHDAIDYVHMHAAIQRIRDLHRPETTQAVTGDCAIEECDHEDACPTIPVTICTECSRIAEESNPYYGEIGLTNVCYLCPTIRALDGERG